MLVLTFNEHMQNSIEIPEHVQDTIPNGHSDKVKQSRTSRLSSKNVSFEQNHREKISNIRRQLNLGTYDINERLDVVIDRFIENLISKRMEENEAKSKPRYREK